MVVPGRIEGQVAEHVPPAGEHSDVQFVDEDKHECADVAAAESDVAQPAVASQREFAVGVDLVVADPGATVDQRDSGGGNLVATASSAVSHGDPQVAAVLAGNRPGADLGSGMSFSRPWGVWTRTVRVSSAPNRLALSASVYRPCAATAVKAANTETTGSLLSQSLLPGALAPAKRFCTSERRQSPVQRPLKDAEG